MNALSDDFIKGLLAPKPAKASKPKGKRTSKTGFNTTDRTVTNWFHVKNRHSLGVCTNPDCPDDRPRKTEEGNSMVAEIDDITMCRLCFVAGYGQVAQEASTAPGATGEDAAL